METIIKIALLLVAIFLGYYLVNSIFTPIRQKAEFERVEALRIERLKMIRNAQFAYRELNREFTASWDTLIHTVKNDSFRLVRQIGDENVEDAQVFRDTTYVSIKDSLFRNFPVDSLPYIPEAGNARFELNAGVIERGGVPVHVFEARDTRPVRRSRVLQVGSMNDATFSGNWE